MKYKHHFKLEFDVQSNQGDLIELLRDIAEMVQKNLEKYTETIVLPTATILNGTADE